MPEQYNISTGDESIFERAKRVFDSVLPKLKKQEQNLRKKSAEAIPLLATKKKWTDPVDAYEAFTPVYKDSIKQLYRIKPHADSEYYPEKLFVNLSPHRQQEESEWIKDNYEAKTLPVWIDYQNTIKRGANPNNYSVAWPEKWTEEFEAEGAITPKEYLETEVRIYGSIHTWFLNVLFDVKEKDANGCTAVQPYKVEFEETEDGGLATSSEMIDPVPVYYACDKMLAFEEDEYYLFLSDEKSLVKYDGGVVRDGYVFYWFDKTNIIRIFQTGKKIDWEFQAVVYLEHNWDAVPVWRHKGQPEMRGATMYYQARFDFAVGNLNLVAKNQINKQMAEANGAWPYRIMVSEPCDYNDNEKGRCTMGILRMDGNEMGQCPKCHGSGMKDKPSPGSTMMVDRETLADNNLGLDRIKYVSPNPEILKHLQDTIEQDEIKARNILHIYSTNSEATGTDPTATGKWIDLKSMYAFIRPIIDEGFDIYEGVINAITHMRYGDRVEPVKVIRPVDLDYKTSADYLAEYTDLLEKGAPPVVLYGMLEKYIKSMFYESGRDRQVWRLVLAADSVAAKKDDEIRSMVVAGTLPKWRAILHTSIFMFINDLMIEDPKFLDLDFEEQKAKLFEKAKAEAEEIKSSSENSLTNAIPIPNRPVGGAQAAAA